MRVLNKWPAIFLSCLATPAFSQQGQATLEDLRQQVEELTQAMQGGTSKFLLSGDSVVNYFDEEGENGTFGVEVAPVAYWKVSDRILFEAGLEFELEDEETEVALETGQLYYDVCPYATLQLGKFLMPFGYFQQNLHRGYINKLPEGPIALSEDTTLAPETDVGVQIRGPVLVGSLRFNYALYVTNGPALDIGATDPATAGMLTFDNFDDNNNSKAYGGRVGFQPLPELELGYSALVARVGPDGTAFADIDATLQDVDLNYVKPLEFIKGNLDVRGEWVQSNVDEADFGAGLQDNDRSGLYGQVAYRPTMVDGPVGNLEAVVRYDDLDQPNGSALEDESAWTVGMNYWAGTTSVFKLAYEDTDQGESAVFFQFAIGF